MADHETDGGADEKEGAASQKTASEAKEAAPAEVVKATNGGEPVSVKPAAAGGHGATPAVAGHDHGLAHTTPVLLLIGILAALMVLTVLTVSVTSIDLGAQGNLVVAMIIATVKAALVVAFFMHLVWDKKLHLILFLTSVLFLILFLSLSVNDRGEYQHDIDAYTKAQTPAK